MAFSRRLGPVERVRRRPDGAEIFRVTLDPAKNPAADYLKGTFDWHIDGMTDDIPIMATVLSAHAVAASGGETEFASTYAAYDDLSDDEKQQALDRSASCTSFAASQRLVAPERRRPTSSRCGASAHRRRTRWCGSTSHGRRSLVLGATTDHVVGMGRGRGSRVPRRPARPVDVPERVYRHEWAVGDLVIWDNRGVLHRATRYDPSSARDMHRTTIAGERGGAVSGASGGSSPRIPPLPPDQWGDDVRAGIAALRPPGATQELRRSKGGPRVSTCSARSRSTRR